MVRVRNGREHWSESGRCVGCHAALVRELTDTDRSVVFMKRSDWQGIAERLNGRPRQTLGWLSPSEKLTEALR